MNMYAFDYVGRTRRFQDVLAAQGVACGLVMKAANIRYLTGFWGYATRAEYSEPRRLICLVVPQKGKPLLIVPKIEYDFARVATRGLPIDIRRHVEWTEEGETEDSWGIARDYLRKAGGASGKLAFERQNLTSKAIDALEQSFDKRTFVDSSGWIEEARAVKDDVEIALMTRCAEICVEQYEVQVKALPEKRWREYELAIHGWEHVVQRCAEVLDHTDVNSPIGEGVQLITSGQRLARAHGSASCKHIEPDDIVALDYCRVPYLLGYRMSMGRIVSLRKLKSEEKDIDAITTKAYQVGLAMTRPGTSCSDIDGAIRQVLVDGKLGPWVVHRNGRGFGIEGVEIPEIKVGTKDMLKAGMVISIEPSIYREGFASRVENAILVTPNGAQVMTKAPIGIRVLA
jgi:Xaa-Pro aminopeptidase